MDKGISRLGIPLGILCGVGPMATDMYLGAMPSIAASLDGSAASVQLSVMAFFLGFTVGQLFYGPVSDRTGRKPMIYLALAIFVVASLGCMVAGDVRQLLAWRLLQGIGGSIGMVMASAVIRDLYTGAKAARLMSLVVLVNGVAPIVAPLIGSLMLGFGSWRLIFLTLMVLGVVAAVLAWSVLPETRMDELRQVSRPHHAFKWYGHLLGRRDFIPYAGTLALAQGGFFVYIAGSSFIFIDLYGLSPIAYSLLFSVNAIGLGIGTQVAARRVPRFGLRAVARVSTAIYGIAALLLLAIQLAGAGGVMPTAVLLFVMVSSLGGIMPTCSVLSLEGHGAISGVAAALMGALGFGAGALTSFLLGLLEDGTATPMIAIIALCAVAAAVASHLTFPRGGGPVQMAHA
ncbi:MAG: multidrug effflux MFS transporter [Mesorhizobium sp.]|nr:multidrug effflux MFS transporter [Mesorhizobium sp.]MCO5164523.1 multidrug effflux MFS transporter [Mesorhizobium sp.]